MLKNTPEQDENIIVFQSDPLNDENSRKDSFSSLPTPLNKPNRSFYENPTPLQDSTNMTPSSTNTTPLLDSKKSTPILPESKGGQLGLILEKEDVSSCSSTKSSEDENSPSISSTESNESKRGKRRRRRVSMGLSMTYNDEQHMPRYSQVKKEEI